MQSHPEEQKKRELEVSEEDKVKSRRALRILYAVIAAGMLLPLLLIFFLG